MPNGFTIKDIQDGLSKGHFTAEEIFKKYSENAGEANKNLNAYLSVFDTPQNETRSNKQSSLCGVPCAIKDNMLIEGTVATAGSKILKNYISAYDATVIKKLKKSGVS